MANQYRSVLASGGASTGGDALPAEVLSGKTFTNDNGAQTGTMANNGAVSGVATPSNPYTIPEGYHNGNGTVTAASEFLDKVLKFGYSNGSITTEGDSISVTTNGEAIIIDLEGKNYTSIAHTMTNASAGPNSIGFIASDNTVSMTQYNSAGTVSIPSGSRYALIFIGLNASDSRSFTFS